MVKNATITNCKPILQHHEEETKNKERKHHRITALERISTHYSKAIYELKCILLTDYLP